MCLQLGFIRKKPSLTTQKQGVCQARFYLTVYMLLVGLTIALLIPNCVSPFLSLPRIIFFSLTL